MKSKWSFVDCIDWHARIGLGWMFMYSGALKVADPGMFAESVANYRLIPASLAGVVALVLPMVEVLTGATLAFTKWRREAAFLSTVMLGVFTAALVSAAVRGLDISCGCFGEEAAGGTVGIVKDIIRDIMLLFPSLWLMRKS